MEFAQRNLSFLACFSLLLATADAWPAESAAGTRLHTPSNQPIDQSSASLVEQGWKAYQQGDLTKAVALYRRAVAAAPQEAPLWYDLGCLQGLNQNNAQAKKTFLRVLRLKPSFAQAHDALGQLAEQEGQPEQAKAAYEKAHTLEPYHPLFIRHLAYLALRNKNTKEAHQQLKNLVTVDPSDTEARYQLGLLEMENHAPDLAITQFQAIVTADLHHVGAWNGLGLAYARIGEMGKAVEALETARKLKPENPATHSNLGLIAAKQEKWDAARSAWKQALDLAPHFEPAQCNLKALDGQDAKP